MTTYAVYVYNKSDCTLSYIIPPTVNSMNGDNSAQLRMNNTISMIDQYLVESAVPDTVYVINTDCNDNPVVTDSMIQNANHYIIV